MRFVQWIRSMLAPRASANEDSTFDQAMRLSDEVLAEIRERTHSSHPFRAVLVDLIFGPHSRDPFVIGDAFELMQESRIYRGAPNGHDKS